MLEGGEITLCYSILLATGLASIEDDLRELWDLFACAVGGTSSLIVHQTTNAMVAITVVVYAGGEGIEALFPWLHKELEKRNFGVARATCVGVGWRRH